MIEPDVLVVRYGELALKGGNRRRYEQHLARNLRRALDPIGKCEVQCMHARIVIFPRTRALAMARRAAEVFGIKSVSPAYRVTQDLEEISERSKELVSTALANDSRPRPLTFAVRVRRADKDFPMRSVDLERHLADQVLPIQSDLKVQLTDPQLELGVEIRGKNNYVFVERIPGPGGLPVGTSGRGLCLLSGGIDSPVAAWLTMKRGLAMGFVSFHSFPYLGEGSKRKVADLARAVAHYQGRAQLLVVPFTEVQEAIRDAAPERYRTVLYRRMMNRIADTLAAKFGYGVLVTGECLGQVASQTLENMECIGQASGRLTLRPLVAYDKEEVIKIARRIGTMEISNRPEPDCCTLFQPKAPVIHGDIGECELAESQLAMDELVAKAVQGTEITVIDPED